MTELAGDYKGSPPQLVITVEDVPNTIQPTERAWKCTLLSQERKPTWSVIICAKSEDDRISELAPMYFQQLFREFLVMTKQPILEFKKN